MTRSASARLAQAALVVTAGLIALYGWFYYLDRDAGLQVYGFPGGEVALTATAAVIGFIVVGRYPKNPIGWMFLVGFGLLGAITNASQLYSVLALRVSHPNLPGGGAAAWLGSWLFIPSENLLMTFGVLLFPDGRLPSPRWRPFAWAVGGVLIISSASAAVGALPTRPNFRIDAGGSIVEADRLGLEQFQLLVAICAVVCIVALGRRVRRSRGDERQQMKWFLFAVAMLVGALVLSFLTAVFASTGAPPAWANLVFALVSLLVPIAIGVAILRYRLYDIDLVISRTLVYAALAVFITGVYVGIVVGLGSVLGGAGRPNLGLSIVATAVVAVAFQPLRERLQHVANRLVYGHRASPYEVLSEFSREVGSSYAGEDALLRLAQVLVEGTGAEQAAVYLGDRQVAVYPPNSNGAVAGEERSLEVWHQGRLLGKLVVRKRRGEVLTPMEEKLLGDLANQAGLVLSNVGLTADLRARLEELRASRQRLVRAQDEERRRLERNLHDGAQQHLVALKIRLGLAETLAAKDPEKLRSLLDDLQLEVDSALATMRDLAQGIYPPLLAERGLKEALEAQARRATVPVTIEAQGLGRYPQDVEAAVYFCCLEALQNVQKYARAGSATVRIEQANGLLSFEVSDDGVGFDPGRASSGSGLTNLRDRLDALGGDLIVRSAPGAGTTLGGRVRLAPSRREAVGAEL